MMPTVRIDASTIKDWNSFHDVFAEAFGFPDFYGRNLDAWIDCMTDLGVQPEHSMLKVYASPGDPLLLQLDNVNEMPQDIFRVLIEDAGFVNWRRLEVGEPAVLIVSSIEVPIADTSRSFGRN